MVLTWANKRRHCHHHILVAIIIKRPNVVVVLWVVERCVSHTDVVARMTTSTHDGSIYVMEHKLGHVGVKTTNKM